MDTGPNPPRSMALTPDLVARAHRHELDPGPTPGFTPAPEATLEELAARLQAARPPGPLWVFGYGSLIWKPGFEVAERRPATAFGWHRQFCIDLHRWRGSPDLPGLMLALQRGGQCRGLLLRIPEAQVAAALRKLVSREINTVEDLGMARFIPVRTAQGPVSALVFWAGPQGQGISAGLSPEIVAWRVAHACGHVGSNAEYLRETVAGLEALAIRDHYLWRLQDLVAQEIRRWP